jgi:hypothetical protein
MSVHWGIPAALGLAAATAVVVATNGDEQTAAARPPEPAFTRSCDVTSQVAPHPVRPADLVAGPLRIMGLRSLERGKPSDLYRPQGASAGQVKAPVVLTGTRDVTVVVPSSHRRALSFFYESARGGPDAVRDGDAVIRFQACGGDSTITGYPGAIVYGGPWPQCVPVDFWVEGDDKPIRRQISFGARRCR